jgi:hypothetical protein
MVVTVFEGRQQLVHARFEKGDRKLIFFKVHVLLEVLIKKLKNYIDCFAFYDKKLSE